MILGKGEAGRSRVSSNTAQKTPLVRLENQPRDARRGFSLSVIQSQLFLVELRCLFSERLNLALFISYV
jgi:hypothetical protein